MFYSYSNNFLNNKFSKFCNKFIYTTNHKTIGSLYLAFAIFSGVIGTSFSMFIRLELSGTGNVFLRGDYQLYNVLITAHGLLCLLYTSPSPRDA
jgi:heme/copper-type cytochrome/quinol oxidase subunit 1